VRICTDAVPRVSPDSTHQHIFGNLGTLGLEYVCMRSGYQNGLVLCCLALVALVVWSAAWGSSTEPLAVAEAAEISPTATASAPTPRATTLQMHGAPNTRTYTNAAYDFSLTYPTDLSISNYDEGDGMKSILFQKPHVHVGFEMFITPDPGDNPLTPTDIELDFPGLQMEGTESLTVGTGTPAVAFASDVSNFGPVAELWFTHDGYLFEIVTYPTLGPWLSQIIDTIRF
jgi:hypothetical protein